MADKYVYNTSNFDEPEPLANKRSFMLGMTITFMVSLRVFRSIQAQH